jgi:hypothetical protein
MEDNYNTLWAGVIDDEQQGAIFKADTLVPNQLVTVEGKQKLKSLIDRETVQIKKG